MIIPFIRLTCVALLSVRLLAADAQAATSWPADFTASANFGFADAVAEDGRGGWSDQGPANSFPDFPVGAQRFAGVPFSILDPANTGGRSVVSFAHQHLPNGAHSAVATLPAGATGRYLYVLHSACWAGPETDGAVLGTVTAGDGPALEVRVGRDVADWWNPQTLSNGALVATRMNGAARVGVYLSRFDLGAPRAVATLTFQSTGKALWIVVGATLAVQDTAVAPVAAPPLTITANQEWKPLASYDLVVAPGTALDRSAWIDHAPAGSRGRVFARPDGHLAFANAPANAVRFFGSSFGYDVATPERADPAAFAEAVRRQGYNLVRLHFLDAFLAGNVRWGKVIDADGMAAADRRAADGQALDPAALAHLDRLVAELKQRGIYLFLDAMSSWTGYYPVNPWTPQNGVVDLRLRMYVDPAARAHYRAAVTQLLTHRNPLTGTTLAEDPQVVTILGHNETAINLWKDTGWKDILLPAWRTFLAKTYPDPAAWRTAWGGGTPPASFAAAEIFTLADSEADGPRRLDVATFLAGIEAETSDFMAGVIRRAGYQGIYTNYDHYKSVRYYLARARLDAVTMHAYHCHPTNFIQAGSKVNQASSLADDQGWWRNFMGSRIAGLPQLFTEYGHVYWNRYRYEEGLTVGAYASFQGVDMLLAHAAPVRISEAHPMKPFGVGDDPIARASQVVTGLTWQSGAVMPARQRVDVRITRSDALIRGNAAIAGEQSRIGLLTGLAMAVEGGPGAPAAALTVPLVGGATLINTSTESKVVEAAGGESAIRATVADLRTRGLLPSGNRSDPDAGIYESDTGELLLQAKQLRFSVATPTVAGIAFDPQRQPSGTAVSAGALQHVSASIPAGITVAALDGLPIEVSRHLLLVVATDARNANEEYADAAGVELKKLGTGPTLVQAGHFTITLARADRQPALAAWALALNGTRQDRLLPTAVPGGLTLDLDTSTWACGPTPFIELSLP